MLKSYFDTIPDEIEEAAMMDGLNRLQIIFRITVPLAMSGLISVFVYCFMVAWNDYLFASIFLSSASNFTLPVGLNALFSTPDYIWGRMMAASLVTALPAQQHGVLWLLTFSFKTPCKETGRFSPSRHRRSNHS